MHRHASVASVIMRSTSDTFPLNTLEQPIILEQAELAQAAGWLLGETSNRGDQILAAQILCTLDSTACVFALQGAETRRRLAYLAREAFDIWYFQPNERNREIAELFGLVLCHGHLRLPKDGGIRKDLTDLRLYQSKSFGGTFLQAFEFASTKYSCYRPEDKEIILHITFLLAIINSGQAIPNYQWIGLSRFFSIRCTPQLVDVLLGLWARIFCHVNRDESSFNHTYAFRDLADEGYKKTVLTRNLSNAVICGTRILSSIRGNPQSELHAMQGYTACLQRIAGLSAHFSRGGLTRVIDGVADLIVSYVDPLTSSNPGEASQESVRVAIEAVLALHALVDRNPRPDKVPASQAARAEQLRIGGLIDAAVQIMLADSESLVTSKLLPRTQPRALTWIRPQVLTLTRGEQERVRERVRGLETAQAVERARVREGELKQELERARAPVEAEALTWEVAWELPRKVARELDRVRERLQQLVRELERELEQEVERELAPEGALQGALRGALEGALDWTSQGGLDRLLDEALGRLPERLPGLPPGQAMKLAKDLAQRLQVESSILRVLLWVWKRSSAAQLDRSDRRKIFLSSCRLWAPLDTRIHFALNGIEWGSNGERLTFDDGNRDKVLTSDDLNCIVGFVEDLQKDREKSEFIARNAD
ncbi:hypothetical protein FRC00_006188, partial [Tulasnella sp. 408]